MIAVRPRPDDIIVILCALYNKCRRRGRGVTKCHRPYEEILKASGIPGDRFRVALNAMTGKKAAKILNKKLEAKGLTIPEEPLIWMKRHGGGSFSYGLTKLGAILAHALCGQTGAL